MKLSIITTATNPIERQDAYDEAMSCYTDLADEVIVTGEDWPFEFEWSHIGKTFQEGYDLATGDWVIRADLDYFFHEQDMSRIRHMLELYRDNPAASFWKYQFILVDRYSIKSRPVICLNKAKFGDRIKLNGGGDLCQATLDGQELRAADVPEIKVPLYNYDFSWKTEEVIRKDFGRFARAWNRTFNNWNLGGPDDDSAFEVFKKMVIGRYAGRGGEPLRLEEHPKYIQKRIKELTPDRLGHSMFGWINESAEYYKG